MSEKILKANMWKEFLSMHPVEQKEYLKLCIQNGAISNFDYLIGQYGSHIQKVYKNDIKGSYELLSSTSGCDKERTEYFLNHLEKLGFDLNTTSFQGTNLLFDYIYQEQEKYWNDKEKTDEFKHKIAFLLSKGVHPETTDAAVNFSTVDMVFKSGNPKFIADLWPVFVDYPLTVKLEYLVEACTQKINPIITLNASKKEEYEKKYGVNIEDSLSSFIKLFKQADSEMQKDFFEWKEESMNKFISLSMKKEFPYANQFKTQMELAMIEKRFQDKLNTYPNSPLSSKKNAIL